MTDVRVRFAPSPTGHLHVGNARTALFNWLLARGSGGAFVLRVEDTDAERSTLESEHSIVEDLRWLGLDWDEGPDRGGPFAPYRQSDRLELYRSTADTFIDRGLAYYCFCSPEQLETERRAALAAGFPPKYSGRCRSIDPAAARRRVDAGEAAAVRFAVPAHRDVTFRDLVRGDVTFNTDVIGDPVIVRSDGRPAYNFAVVIDDARMKVTHVIRGEDHISNTPRQVLIYEALTETPPAFAHLSLVLGPDHAPLSKRHGDTSVAEFRERGFLPEALVNYLALLGWSPGDGEELLPIAEMSRRFDLSKVGHSAAVFDVGKLAWMNRHYMKEAPAARIARDALKYFVRAGFVTHGTDESIGYLESILGMAVGSVDRLEEIPDRVAFIFDWDVSRAAELVRAEPDGARAVQAFADEIAGAGPLDRDAFRAAATRAREKTALKGRALFHPIRVAMTAADSGPELDLAIPAIDRAAALPAGCGISSIAACQERARLVATAVE
ncbi:MAG TPA: glutamate--tRNA ligase [Vicinamibacterales bacterium]|nr:glutamate--tRNA ligase [Vicinamibacterales bacterium]